MSLKDCHALLCALPGAGELGAYHRDPHLRIRLTMAGFEAFVMLCCVLVLNLIAVAGLARLDWIGWWSVVVVAGMVSMLLLIRLGRVLHWRDPSLIQLQIRFALVSTATAYVVAGQARGILPVILSIILVFGIFGVTPRQMVLNMAYALVLFAAAFGMVAWLAEPWRLPALEAAYAAMVILALGAAPSWRCACRGSARTSNGKSTN